ncbi:hypothetical protein AK812_SmicGene6640 [Symbiodinium microadriaticum]|uniref:Uncharacterized protein n=1 Tax=Symbiodinium microadriaticum TaxID=2951 RepID=A0A1Q9EQM4_SYMMI|nr:hypothetical protein AK812_SmicGene6640 [Symbiodinium microadriaticum]
MAETNPLTPLDLEEIFNEVRLSHAMNFGQEEQGCKKVLLTMACRAKLELFAPTAFAEKLEFLIEHHLFVYALIVDTSLDEVLNEFAGRLRSIFTAYAGSARSVERDRRRHRGAMVEVTAVSTQKQGILKDRGEPNRQAFSDPDVSTSITSIPFRLRGASWSLQDPERLAAIVQAAGGGDDEVSLFASTSFVAGMSQLCEDETGAAFQYMMSYQVRSNQPNTGRPLEEPNPFISFLTRFEKFLRYQALDDSRQASSP